MEWYVVFGTDNLAHWAEHLALIAGILIALGVLWNKGLHPVLKFFRVMVHTADRLEAAVPILEEIAKDFKPNDGKSLADVIGRMDRNVRTNARNNHVLYDLVASFPDANPGLFPPMQDLEEAPDDPLDRENQI